MFCGVHSLITSRYFLENQEFAEYIIENDYNNRDDKFPDMFWQAEHADQQNQANPVNNHGTAACECKQAEFAQERANRAGARSEHKELVYHIRKQFGRYERDQICRAVIRSGEEKEFKYSDIYNRS